MVSHLHLTLASWQYDRILPLVDGTVRVEGIEINYVPLWPQEIFYRMLKYKEFDVAELSFGAYLTSLFTDRSFVAIPVFPSRAFRHNGVFINARSGIERPEDLVGKRVGVPEYRQSAAIWTKGIMSDLYGVKPHSVEYFVGPLEDPTKRRRYFVILSETDVLPKEEKFKVRRVDGKFLSDMLAEGEIDALYSALVPSTFRSRPDRVKRLFQNYVEDEKEYFRKTKIFPINHVIVLRRDLYEKHRWIAKSLYKAFDEAKSIVMDRLSNASGTLHYALPWLFEHYRETVEVMGEDYWPYGLSKNYKTLDTFIRYAYEQGIIPERVKPEDIFAKETTDT
ncbi:hypothetical protein MetMK1DRAFT_00008040 [Metallosphaera yellowstonensis MK1]|uniref:ABC-type nitrate/sulfonate/bicarbonate transport system, periplasmic component n=1 Tax=Metallosphaera yellowstonensis MK1 TaxID=671065 RepID=H2C231_9CREN|nr:4,5-dihydroxyphthalate decarboxylase [Metallosphaera yellowstonensis]EHP70302.1 hypothetical protein MetMK1DRAFT_00008040 [Metallosphaera yellowstonensis MK1]